MLKKYMKHEKFRKQIFNFNTHQEISILVQYVNFSCWIWDGDGSENVLAGMCVV